MAFQIFFELRIDMAERVIVERINIALAAANERDLKM
jgi:hypothetical protein